MRNLRDAWLLHQAILSLPVEDLWLPFDTVFNEASTITCLTYDSWSYAQLVDFMNTCTIDHDAVERKCSVATLSSDIAEMIAITALMIASVARLADGEAVDVPSSSSSSKHKQMLLLACLLLLAAASSAPSSTHLLPCSSEVDLGMHSKIRQRRPANIL